MLFSALPGRHVVQTDTTRESRRRYYTDVLKVCQTSASDQLTARNAILYVFTEAPAANVEHHRALLDVLKLATTSEWQLNI